MSLDAVKDYPGPSCFDWMSKWESGELVRSLSTSLQSLGTELSTPRENSIALSRIRNSLNNCSIWQVNAGKCPNSIDTDTELQTPTHYSRVNTLIQNNVASNHVWHPSWLYNPKWESLPSCFILRQAMDSFHLHEYFVFLKDRSPNRSLVLVDETFVWAISRQFRNFAKIDWKLLVVSQSPLFVFWNQLSKLVREGSNPCLLHIVRGFGFLEDMSTELDIPLSRMGSIASENSMDAGKGASLDALVDQVQHMFRQAISTADKTCTANPNPNNVCGKTLRAFDCLFVAPFAVGVFALFSPMLFHRLIEVQNVSSRHVILEEHSLITRASWLYMESSDTSIAIIVCHIGSGDDLAQLGQVGSVHALGVRTRDDCFSSSYSKTIWQRIELAALQSELVVLVSPYSITYNIDAILNIIHLMRTHTETLQVVGAPTVDSDMVWRWPCHIIRRQYWKIQVTASTTGHVQTAVGQCFRADTTSGTRVVRASLARRLANSTLAHENPDGSWLVEIDMLLKFEEGVPVHTCQSSTPLRENPYARDVRWTEHQAYRFQAEVLRIGDADPRVACLWFDYYIPRLLHLQGLVLPWCYRRALTHALHGIVKWWKALSSKNFVVPLKSTMLFIWRNSAIFTPWNDDIELGLYSELGPARVHQFLSDSVPTWQLPLNVTQFDSDAPLVPWTWQVHTGHIVPVEIKATARIQRSQFPYEVEFLRDGVSKTGARLALSDEHIKHAFETYGVGKGKYFGPRWDSALLHCRVLGHNACLPNCRNSTDCELDKFVALDNWD